MESALPTPHAPGIDGAAASAPDARLIERFDTTGPRYTSYPTADRFAEDFDDRALEAWLRRRASTVGHAPLSVYVHVPFCESVCWYCACNKIATRDRRRGVAYVEDLTREIGLYAARLSRREPVSQLHLGGGTPTFLDDAALRTLVDALERGFAFTAGAERSIEVDPRTVDAERLRALARLRFDRLSFGVQDFDADVQRAVHRVQSTAQVFELTRAARDIGFASINVDLIHGLPRQTASSFGRTLDTLCELRPDRVAVYGYAHLPERFKPQRRIDAGALSGAGERVAMMRAAAGRLGAEGYVHIGMDHFALPGDALAVAQRRGTLHRNFMGYTTQPDCDMLGLGVSAIGRMGPCYAQNHRTLDEWADAVRGGRLPIARGIELDRDDMLRRSTIMAIMCGGEVSFAALESGYLVDPRRVFAEELRELRELEALGLVRVDADGIAVTGTGRFFVRPVAMTFDRYLRAARRRAGCSSVL